jgi:hypothetical protein
MPLLTPLLSSMKAALSFLCTVQTVFLFEGLLESLFYWDKLRIGETVVHLFAPTLKNYILYMPCGAVFADFITHIQNISSAKRLLIQNIYTHNASLKVLSNEN